MPLAPDVRAACDFLFARVSVFKGVRATTFAGPFLDEERDRRADGCSVSFQGSFAALNGAPTPFDTLHQTLVQRGWSEDLSYSADGADGTVFAFSRNNALCIFRGQWDGGDPADPEYKPSDKYTGEIHCTLPDTKQ